MAHVSWDPWADPFFDRWEDAIPFPPVTAPTAFRAKRANPFSELLETIAIEGMAKEAAERAQAEEAAKRFAQAKPVLPPLGVEARGDPSRIFCQPGAAPMWDFDAPRPTMPARRAPLRVTIALVEGPVLDELDLEPEEPILDLHALVESITGEPLLALEGPLGIELDPAGTVGDSGLRSGDRVVPVVAPPVRLHSTSAAFAAVREDGSVVAWGDAACGGDCSAVDEQFSGEVLSVYSNDRAFAALMETGALVTWGDPRCGGDSRSVGEEVAQGIRSVCSTKTAFAALHKDGFVTSWGAAVACDHKQRLLLRSDVLLLASTRSAFAAVRKGGSVVAWGEGDEGGDNSGVMDYLGHDVKRVYSTDSAFAAVKENGSVVTWGSGTCGGDCSLVEEALSSGVERVYSSSGAFSALRRDGSVVTWGRSSGGGDSTAVQQLLVSGVRSISSSRAAFAALKEDGSVVAWGAPDCGGSACSMQEAVVEIPGRRVADIVPVSVEEQLRSGVVRLCATDAAFAAVKRDGSVVVWGESASGGCSRKVEEELSSGVVRVFSTRSAFAALKDCGSVVTWGGRHAGGDSSSVKQQLVSGVVHIHSTHHAFAAVKSSGSIVTWGNKSKGGAGADVAMQAPSLASSTPWQCRSIGPEDFASGPNSFGLPDYNQVSSPEFTLTQPSAFSLEPILEDASSPGPHSSGGDEPVDELAPTNAKLPAEPGPSEQHSARSKHDSSASPSGSSPSPSKPGRPPRETPWPKPKKKMSPEEAAERSDAFWASVEATIGPAQLAAADIARTNAVSHGSSRARSTPAHRGAGSSTGTSATKPNTGVARGSSTGATRSSKRR